MRFQSSTNFADLFRVLIIYDYIFIVMRLQEVVEGLKIEYYTSHCDPLDDHLLELGDDKDTIAEEHLPSSLEDFLLLCQDGWTLIA